MKWFWGPWPFGGGRFYRLLIARALTVRSRFDAGRTGSDAHHHGYLGSNGPGGNRGGDDIGGSRNIRNGGDKRGNSRRRPAVASCQRNKNRDRAKQARAAGRREFGRVVCGRNVG